MQLWDASITKSSRALPPNISEARMTADALQFWAFSRGSTDGQCAWFDRGRQDGHQGAVPQPGHLRDRGGARRLRQDGTRTAGDTGNSRAYVPIFGDGIHGRNPNPQHRLCVFDLEKRALLTTIDLRPYIAPHTLKLAPDGLIYITCENSAKVVAIDPKTNKVVGAIDSGSTNGHRLIIARREAPLYRERGRRHRFGDRSAQAKLLGKIKTPRPLAGIAISADGRTVVAVDDAEPALFLIDTEAGQVRQEVRLKDVPKAAQIARYAPDNSLLGVTSLNSDTVSLIDPSFREQTAIKVGSQPMDMAFRGDELFVACQGDGSVHVVNTLNRRHKNQFSGRHGL
jgi:hypothetical protein